MAVSSTSFAIDYRTRLESEKQAFENMSSNRKFANQVEVVGQKNDVLDLLRHSVTSPSDVDELTQFNQEIANAEKIETDKETIYASAGFFYVTVSPDASHDTKILISDSANYYDTLIIKETQNDGSSISYSWLEADGLMSINEYDSKGNPINYRIFSKEEEPQLWEENLINMVRLTAEVAERTAHTNLEWDLDYLSLRLNGELSSSGYTYYFDTPEDVEDYHSDYVVQEYDGQMRMIDRARINNGAGSVSYALDKNTNTMRVIYGKNTTNPVHIINPVDDPIAWNTALTNMQSIAKRSSDLTKDTSIKNSLMETQIHLQSLKVKLR